MKSIVFAITVLLLLNCTQTDCPTCPSCYTPTTSLCGIWKCDSYVSNEPYAHMTFVLNQDTTFSFTSIRISDNRTLTRSGTYSIASTGVVKFSTYFEESFYSYTFNYDNTILYLTFASGYDMTEGAYGVQWPFTNIRVFGTTGWGSSSHFH